MHAHAGDLLVVEGDPARTGLIIAVPHADGSPPYIVKWLPSEHIAMVTPGEYARIIRAEDHAPGAGDGPASGSVRPRGSPVQGHRHEA